MVRLLSNVLRSHRTMLFSYHMCRSPDLGSAEARIHWLQKVMEVMGPGAAVVTKHRTNILSHRKLVSR